MQIDIAQLAQIDRMNLPELDMLRHQLRLSKKELCDLGDFDPSTYSRWMRHVNGRPGGSSPLPRSLRMIRQALKDEVSRRLSSQLQSRRLAS